MTRFILFFTFFKIFLTCSSLAATVEEEAPNPTHTVLKQTFKTLQLWNAVPISLQESFTQRFPAPFALLDALDSFDKITREILRIPGISRKASAERVKKAIEEKYSVSSSDNFVFPVIPRFIDKEELLDSVWDSLKSTSYGEIITRENRGRLLKDSIIFYGLFFVSFQDYGCMDDISGFIVIKNFFLAGAPGSPLQIKLDLLERAQVALAHSNGKLATGAAAPVPAPAPGVDDEGGPAAEAARKLEEEREAARKLEEERVAEAARKLEEEEEEAEAATVVAGGAGAEPPSSARSGFLDALTLASSGNLLAALAAHELEATLAAIRKAEVEINAALAELEQDIKAFLSRVYASKDPLNDAEVAYFLRIFLSRNLDSIADHLGKNETTKSQLKNRSPESFVIMRDYLAANTRLMNYIRTGIHSQGRKRYGRSQIRDVIDLIVPKGKLDLTKK